MPHRNGQACDEGDGDDEVEEEVPPVHWSSPRFWRWLIVQ